MRTDAHGNLVSGASEAAVRHYDSAIRELGCYVGDPVATLANATAESPDFVMAHVANAHIHMAGTEKPGVAVARESLEAARALPKNTREAGHVSALAAYVAGDVAGGHEILERVALEHPRDLLAVQIAHLWDFFRGDARRLRERIAMVLPHWSPADADYHLLLGMHAFGLEECGDYARAEESGRQAVALNKRDCWAQHAVAHVLEMQGRQDEGIAWMRGNEDGWAPDNFFAVHNWWHLALYHLERGETADVLALYDGPIRGSRSTVIIDMVDASALLWRLHLQGVELGARWAELADDWAPAAEDGFYAFNDAHALMAFIGAGRAKEVRRVIAAMERAIGSGTTNDAMTREVGLPVARALVAFAEGDYPATVETLRPVRSIANRFGGSHAQRDFIDLTLTEAAIRGGDRAMAAAFAAEREWRRPESPLSRLLVGRAAALRPRAAA